MSRSSTHRTSRRPITHRVTGLTFAALLVTALFACTAAPGSPSPEVPTSPPRTASATVAPSPSPSTTPTAVPASAEPTGLRWVEGGMAGVSATTDPTIAQELFVLGWSRGYLGFTSTYTKAKATMQSLLVTSSSDGLHWQGAGRLDLGGDDAGVIVTQVVEGPAGLLATGEPPGCSIHKAAVRMWRSADGTTWTPIDLEGVFGADSLPSVSGGSAGYIVLAASGSERAVWTSSDGASWRKRAVPLGGFNPQSVASFGGGFLLAGTTDVAPPDCGGTTGDAVAHRKGSAWSSLAGSPWASADLPNVLDGTETTMSVNRLNDETVLAEEVATTKAAPNGVVRDWTSSDGLTWRQNDALTRSLGYLLTDGTRTVFVGSTDQGGLVIRVLTHDLRAAILGADTAGPTIRGVGEAALGPAGIVVADAPGATSWLGVPIP